MSGMTSTCLGRMPLHGGWGVLRLSDTHAKTASVPGQPLTIRQGDGAFTLPIYRRDEGTLAVLLPPVEHYPITVPVRGESVTTDFPPAAAPPVPAAEEEAVVLAIDAGLGGGLALAHWLAPAPTLVIVGGRAGVPARPRPSRYLTPHLPGEVIAALPQLEEEGIPSRIALHDWQPGCFDEGPLALLERYLAELPADRRRSTRLYAHAPEGVLEASLPGLEAALAGVHAVLLPPPG